MIKKVVFDLSTAVHAYFILLHFEVIVKNGMEI